MALFKIKRGLAATLPTTYVEGYCYFTTDDGKFYIDTTNTAAGRITLNAYKADILRTARNLQVDLESTSYVSFDGSVDRKNIGISGVLGVANGGTGKSTHTANAVLTGNGTSAVKNVATASGALYATAANGAPKFGTLPVAQGGTGLTVNPSMLINLASNSAANVFAASPRPGVTGTLAVGNGGTGKTSWTANALVYAATTTSLGQIDLGTSGYVLQSNGSANAPSWINATSSNTASTIVKRDGSGNFSAGTITATLSGNAATASVLKGATSSSVPLSNGGTGYISYVYNITKDTTGNPPDSSNANGVLTLNTHSGNYYHQLAFSSNNNLYHRAVSGTALTTSIGWNRIMTSNQAIPYIVGPTTDTTAGTWTGTCEDITTYVDGLTIIYVPKVAGASTTTLNINGLGAKTCYYTNSSRLTTHFSVNTPIMLTYIGGTWKRADYDSNTNTQIRVYRQTSGYNGDYPILVSRTATSSIGTAGTNSSYTAVYGVIGQDGAKTPTINPYTGVITAPGGLNGDATSAGAFTSAASVTLTGDVTGTASSTKGWSVATTLANSGVTAGNYGPSANDSPAHGGTFSVPYITFDAKGRATAASTKTITLPTYTIGNATITIKAGTGLTTGGSFTTNQTSAGTITLNHSNSITAGSVGSAQSPSHGGTFAIPKITYDAQGHITAATTVNITLPSDNNTDTKVTQTVRTTNGEFPILVRGTSAGTSTTTTTTSFGSTTTINLSTGKITEGGVLMERKYGTLIPYGTVIPANTNLNTTAYLKVGNYYQSASANVATFTNCPTTHAFMMQVFSPLSTTLDNETTSTWVYRIRVIQTYTGVRYVQSVSSGSTAGTFTYGAWTRDVVSEADGGVGSTTTPVYIYNGTATAGTSYAKAIKAITRSGTTFTYTCIDGTTGTFTQQDNNTTYTFTNKAATLSWETTTTIATVGGTNITVKLPANPNTNTAHAHAAGNGITLTGSGGTSGTTTIALSDSFTVSGTITANKVYGAVWNDYAEYRWVLKHPDTDESIEPGRCVAENGNDSMSLTNARLQAGVRIISDTYGMCMGETEKAKTPVAVCGRVLAYPFERKVAFNVGDPVCSGPNGTVSKMSREEAMMYPERIVGTVVSKPTYKEWGPNKIPVKGRIWIQVR